MSQPKIITKFEVIFGDFSGIQGEEGFGDYKGIFYHTIRGFFN